MNCPKCRKNVSLLLIHWSYGECAYCTTRSSSMSDEKAKELIKLSEQMKTTKPNKEQK